MAQQWRNLDETKSQNSSFCPTMVGQDDVAYGTVTLPHWGGKMTCSLSTSSACHIAVTMWSSYRHLAPVIFYQPTMTWNHLIYKLHVLMNQKMVSVFELVKITVYNRSWLIFWLFAALYKIRGWIEYRSNSTVNGANLKKLKIRATSYWRHYVQTCIRWRSSLGSA